MVAWAAIGAAASKALPWIKKNGLSFLEKGIEGMGLFSSLFGSKSSGGGTDIGASKTLMNHQMELNKQYTQWLNENGYSQMRAGLEKAGYNPLLAVGATPQQGSISPASATGNEVTTFDPATLLDAAATVASIRKTNAETDQIKLGKVGAITKNLFGLVKGLGVNFAKEIGVYDDIQGLIKKATNTAKGFFDKGSNTDGTPVFKLGISNTGEYGSGSSNGYTFDYLDPNLGKLPPELSRYHR